MRPPFTSNRAEQDRECLPIVNGDFQFPIVTQDNRGAYGFNGESYDNEDND